MIKNRWPYQDDAMNLPVDDLNTAIPFYETKMGFQVVSRKSIPHKSATLSRDAIQIGLAENGGDPTQDGCFFEVDNVENTFTELKAKGLDAEISGIELQNYSDAPWKVFFVVAPDGLCYCFGEKQG